MYWPQRLFLYSLDFKPMNYCVSCVIEVAWAIVMYWHVLHLGVTLASFCWGILQSKHLCNFLIFKYPILNTIFFLIQIFFRLLYFPSSKAIVKFIANTLYMPKQGPIQISLVCGRQKMCSKSRISMCWNLNLIWLVVKTNHIL